MNSMDPAGAETSNVCVTPEELVTPEPATAIVLGPVPMVNALAPLNVMLPTSTLEEMETDVFEELVKTTAALAEFGTVFGDQFCGVFQSPVVGVAPQV